MKKEHLVQLVAPVIRALETATAQSSDKWQCPWRRTGGLARNALTNKPYRGVNSLYGMIDRFDHPDHTPFYATAKQWIELGATLKPREERGEGLMLTLYNTYTKEVEGGEAKHLKFSRPFWVLNSTQVEGWEAPGGWETPEPINEVLASTMLTNALSQGVKLEHGGEAAYYMPSTDTINLPPRTTFKTDEAYWGVLWHEVVHSTGHAERLNREGITQTIEFGSERYAFEELVAELGAAMASAHYEIFTDTKPDSLPYLAHWAKSIREDPTVFSRAAGLAAAAVTYLHKGES